MSHQHRKATEMTTHDRGTDKAYYYTVTRHAGAALVTIYPQGTFEQVACYETASNGAVESARRTIAEIENGTMVPVVGNVPRMVRVSQLGAVFYYKSAGAMVPVY